LPTLRPDLFAYTLKEAAGVCGVLTPWNFPLLIAAQKVAPAVTAGCPVVLKPAPWTPRSALELGRAFEEVDLPAGLLNVVTDAEGDSTAGRALCVHPDVALISFTGSSETGAKVMASAAGTLKRVVLECGGKCPMIVHEDADIDGALDAAMFAVFFNTGQVCNGASRLFLHESIAEEFETRLVEATRELRVGPPSDPDTYLGPVVSDSQRSRVLSYLELGIQEGVEPLLEGGKPDDERLARGHYLTPTIFGGVHAGMRIAREEIFGPVLGVTRYSDLDRAIADANATPFGLAGGIWSRDLDVVNKVTRGLRVGMVWVNEFLAVYPETPHGGYGMSGIGREMGPEAVAEFLESKTVIQKHGPRQPPIS
jgi:acyl-CoA reductase-like NAD-dependent aldehyde dehydrogenase